MNDMVIIWLIVLTIALILEFITTEFVSLWFAIGAIPTAIIAWLWPDAIYVQVILFFVFGFGLMLLTRPILIKYFKKNIVDTNIDSYIGKEAIVKDEINPNQNGTVLFQNLVWTAVSDEEIKTDTLVIVNKIEGNKLIVSTKKE